MERKEFSFNRENYDIQELRFSAQNGYRSMILAPKTDYHIHKPY